MQEVFCVPGASTLLFLPLAHVFARIIEVACVYAGVRIAHTPSTARLMLDLEQPSSPRSCSPSRACSSGSTTPRGRRPRRPARSSAIFDAAADDRDRLQPRRSTTGGPGLRAARSSTPLFDRLVYAKLRAALGGRVDYAISGGAPLGERLGHFFRGIGVTVLEGYGLTETTAGTCINRPEALRIGTVGQPLPGVAVRIDDDGEILITRRAHLRRLLERRRPPPPRRSTPTAGSAPATSASLDDDGFLRITGRKKELIVTAGGKNVAPAVLEDRLRAHPLVGQCVVVGDAQPYIGALVTIDPEAFEYWKTDAASRPTPTSPTWSRTTCCAARCTTAIDDANLAVSKAEGVKRFTILPSTSPSRTATSRRR